MIPQEVREIFAKTNVSHVGTRDARLQTADIMAWGLKLDEENRRLTFFIPRAISQKHLSNLDHNKRLAVTVGEPLSHELYQFKGTFLNTVEATPEDENMMDAFVMKFYDNYLKLFNYPREIVDTFNYKPAIGVIFDIEEIFVQTPGPKAGELIFKKQAVTT